MGLLFDDKESRDFLDKSFELLMAEADRGCILLGVSMLDEQLTCFFKAMLPKVTSNTREKDIFDGKGAFGSLASKLDIAYVCRLLPTDLVDSLHRLRKVRNNLAHKVEPFSIEENLDAIYDVFSRVKGNLTTGMLYLSEEYIRSTYLKKVMEEEHPVEEGKKLFDSEEDAIKYLEENDNVKSILKDKRIKLMFVIGVSALASLIITYRKKNQT